MAEIDDHARSIFFALLDRRPAEWPGALDDACRDRPDLRAKVETLLKAHQALGGIDDGEEPTATDAEGVGAVIGPYRLVEQIGEGGFGVVYLAEQREPVRRKVALKVLKPGMDTRRVVARFEAERQALAIMDHPNIAKVHDGGATPAGRPYFVMELVDGAPITEYCDRNQLNTRRRLELLVQVCMAVQHAHQKGIIHRDLKPSNVLVAVHDGTPVAKVIDFGVAKALGAELTDQSIATGVAQLVGTPLYMSPEQAGRGGLDIDTRSDIYSLGVLLYELLTGSTPFSRERFKRAALDDIRRIIREEDPPKPSTRLSESSDSLPSISAVRGAEPARLTRSLQGDLDWIAMKALEKDRDRRYETAAGLALDIQRHLANEPVSAGPPSTWYRLRKFARRNQGKLAFAALAGGAAALAVVGLIVNTRMVGREKARADLNFQRAREAVNQYFILISQDPDLKSKGLEPLRRKLLAAARDYYVRFVQEGGDDPALRAEFADARMHLGSIVEELADNRHAIEEYELALALCHELVRVQPEVAEHRKNLARCHGSLGRLFHAVGRYQDAEAANLRALAILEPMAGAHPTSSDVKDDLATTYGGLGILYTTTGRPKEAEAAYLKEADLRRALFEFDPAAAPQDRLAASHVHLADLYAETGRQADAEQVYRKAIDLRRALVRDHPENADYRDGLAIVLLNAGLLHHERRRPAQAEPMLREARDIWRKLTDVHPAVTEYQHLLATSLNNLGVAQRDLDRTDEADAAEEEALEIRRKLAATHPAVVKFAVELGGSQCNMGNRARVDRKFTAALDWYSAAAATLQGVLQREERHAQARQFLAKTCYGRGHVLADLARHAEAAAAFTESIGLQPDFAEAHCELARALQRQGRFAEALPALKRGHDLGSRSAEWPYPTAQWIRDCEILIRFDAQLAAMLRGEAPPAAAPDRIGLAEFCIMHKRLPATALRLWTGVFGDARAPADDAMAIQMYNAACAACLAAAGDGLDAAKLGDEERARWRKQALDWLRAALAWWRERAENGAPANRAAIAKRMQLWRDATELAVVRTEAALAKLPEAERGPWRNLWAEVAALQARAKEAAPEPIRLPDK